jgi:hypothetical protein
MATTRNNKDRIDPIETNGGEEMTGFLSGKSGTGSRQWPLWGNSCRSSAVTRTTGPGSETGAAWGDAEDPWFRNKTAQFVERCAQLGSAREFA